jgi:hypothetical protein
MNVPFASLLPPENFTSTSIDPPGGISVLMDCMLMVGLPLLLLLHDQMARVVVINIPGNKKHESFMLNGYIYKPT